MCNPLKKNVMGGKGVVVERLHRKKKKKRRRTCRFKKKRRDTLSTQPNEISSFDGRVSNHILEKGGGGRIF